MQKNDIVDITISELPLATKQLDHPIEKLSGKGNISLLNTGVRVGIVGARKFTPYGREVTSDIASILARAGVTIVSGLALGVDSIAHKSCIDSGGKSIAVLPSGVNKVYPASHFNLAKEILSKDGLLVSEYPSDHIPRIYDFIERNRIIASLSDVLIVTEAQIASGSLHTASFALELGVTVMAVPGNINSPYSAGTNKLIQNGAFPILSAQDVLDHLNIKELDTIEYLPENETEKLVLDQIKTSSATTQELSNQINLSPSELATTLTLLEIKSVVCVQGGYWKLK